MGMSSVLFDLHMKGTVTGEAGESCLLSPAQWGCGQIQTSFFMLFSWSNPHTGCVVYLVRCIIMGQS